MGTTGSLPLPQTSTQCCHQMLVYTRTSASDLSDMRAAQHILQILRCDSNMHGCMDFRSVVTSLQGIKLVPSLMGVEDSVDSREAEVDGSYLLPEVHAEMSKQQQ